MVSAWKSFRQKQKIEKKKKNHQSNFTYDYSKMLLNDVLLSHIPPTKEVTYKEP